MNRRARYTRIFGWLLVIMAKLGVVVMFHTWSVSVGRRGLAPVVIGGDDGEEYLFFAEQIARTGSLSQYSSNVWPVWMGHLMHTMGWRGTLPFKAVLLVASFSTAIVGVRLLRLLAADLYRCRPTPGAEVATAAALLLFPSTLWVASYSIYRDAVLYFLALAVTYAAYRVLVRKQKQYLLALAAGMVLLFYFRWYATVSLGAAIVVWMLLNGGRPQDRWRRRALAVVVVAVAVGGVIASGQSYLFGKALASRDLFDYNQGGSNLGLSYSRSGVFLWPFIYAYTFVTNLVGPLPNQIDGATTLVGFVLEVPVLSCVLYRLSRSPATRRPEALLLVSVAAVWFLLLPIYNDNVGTALRLRVFGYQFLFILFVLDLTARRMVRLKAVARQRASLRRSFLMSGSLSTV